MLSTSFTKIMYALLIFCIIIPLKSTEYMAQNTPKNIENFTLKDYDGKSHSLSDFKNRKAIVLVFISTECPVSNGYNERMKEISKSFGSNEVAFIGINSNKLETVEDIKKHADINKLDFLILKDAGNIIADKLGASVTPEAYVLNNNFQILYHGRIDDSRREEEVKSQDLKNAITSVLRNVTISESETKAFGCTIKRAD